MITNFILNSPNNIFTRSVQKAQQQTSDVKKLSKYIKDQDTIIEAFNRQLEDNIIKAILGAPKLEKIELLTPIKNALWQLWNASWLLGRNHVSKEATTNFSNFTDLVEFAKREDEASKLLRQNRASKKEKQAIYLRDEIDKVDGELEQLKLDYKNEDGSYNVRRYLKDNKIKGDITSQQEQQVIQLLQQKEQRLLNQREEVVNKFIQTQQVKEVRKKATLSKSNTQAITPQTTQRSQRSERRVAEDVGNRDVARRRLTEQNNKNIETTTPKERKEKYPSSVLYPDTKTGRIASEIQKQRYEQGNIPLEQSEFGRIYLEKRLTDVAANLRDKYKQQLLGDKENPGIIQRYFNNKSQYKDRKIIDDIREFVSGNKAEEYIRAADILEGSISKKYEIINKVKEEQEKSRGTQKYYDLDKLIKKLEQTNRDDIVIKLSDDEIKAIETITSETEVPTEITNKQLKKYIQKGRDKAKSINQTLYDTKRIALTELSHAYNLGRMEYFDNNNIKFVKWNVSVEHLKRTLNYKNNRDNHIIRGYRSTFRTINNIPTVMASRKTLNQKEYDKWFDKLGRQKKAVYTPGFSLHGVVCPVCWERSQRDNGYGKGIYLLEQIRNNPQLQPALHPNCLCYLEPVDEPDNKKTLVPIKISSLFNNNIAKWAGGALGTILMYGMYRRTRQPISNLTKKTLPKISKLTNEIVNILIEEKVEDILDTAEDVINNRLNIDDSNKRITEPTFNPPLPQLKIPEKLELKDNQLPTINRAINKNKYNSLANNEIQKSINIATTSNNISPNYNDAVNRRLNELKERVKTYVEYSKTAPSSVKRQILNQYKQDLNYLNSTINQLEDETGILYAQMRNIQQLIREGESNLATSITENISETFASTTIGRNLYNELTELEGSLRNRVDLLSPGGYHDELIKIRESVFKNTDLAEDYFIKVRREVETSFNNLPTNRQLTNLSNELDNITKELSDNISISDIRYRQISKDLETLEDVLNNRLRSISDKIIDLDIERYLTKTSTEDEVLMGMTVLAYRKQIRLLKNRIYGITNLLINK